MDEIGSISEAPTADVREERRPRERRARGNEPPSGESTPLLGILGGGAALIVIAMILIVLVRGVWTYMGGVVDDEKPIESTSVFRTYGGLQAMSFIAKQFRQAAGSQLDQRQVSKSFSDWPPGARRFVIVNATDLPILTVASLNEKSHQAIGLTRRDELLQFVAAKRESRWIVLPVFRNTDDGGVWLRVKILDGREGWILAEPHTARSRVLASVIDREAKFVGGSPE